MEVCLKQHVYQSSYLEFLRTIQLYYNRKQNHRTWLKGWLKERLDLRFDNLLREVEKSVLLDQQTLFMYVPVHFWWIIGNNYAFYSKRRLDHATLFHSISDQTILCTTTSVAQIVWSCVGHIMETNCNTVCQRSLLRYYNDVLTDCHYDCSCSF